MPTTPNMVGWQEGVVEEVGWKGWGLNGIGGRGGEHLKFESHLGGKEPRGGSPPLPPLFHPSLLDLLPKSPPPNFPTIKSLALPFHILGNASWVMPFLKWQALTLHAWGDI